MIYNRLEAKSIEGECCNFCGEVGLPMVKTKCCDKWICCDTNFISIKGGGFCEYEHETYSVCHFHFNESHTGKWKECEECRDFFENKEFENELNFKYIQITKKI